MAKHKLTDTKCRATKPGRYGDGGRLYLYIAAPRSKDAEAKAVSRNWVFRYSRAGRG